MGKENQEISAVRNNKYNKPSKTEYYNQQLAHVDLEAYSGEEAPGVTFINRGEPFSFDSAKDIIDVWGRGKEMPSVYYNENLPSLFIRKLQFEAIEFDEGFLEWVFTGNNGGVTVSISRDSILLSQRFYDSFGFNKISGNEINANRHPEADWLSHTLSYSGKIKSITLSMDHRLFLRLYVNGKEVSTQTCLIDLTKQQLRFLGEKAYIKGNLLVPDKEEAEININWNKKHQKMLGWGGITSPVAYNMLSSRGKELWWKSIKDYNLLWHREYPNGQKLNRDFSNFDQLDDAAPHYYGDNFPNGEISDFQYIKKIQELGGISLFEFWKFPAWIQRDSALRIGAKYEAIDIDAYCEAMISYCKKAEAITGKPPAMVGIQNEVQQTAENWQEMALSLRQALDENGFTEVKIHQQDMPRMTEACEAAAALTANEKAWDAIDYAASHMYDFQSYFQDPDRFDSAMREYKTAIGDKPFLSTELAVNYGLYQTDSYRIAFVMAQLYHKNLTLLDASAIMYCWTLLNTVQPSYAASRSLFGVDETKGFIPYPSYLLRTFGAYSRRIKKDMHRVEVSCEEPELLVTAFSGEQGNTIILLNRSQTVKKCSMPVDFQLSSLERTSQYFQNEEDALPEAVNGLLAIEILPGEMITLSSVPLEI